VQAASDLTRRIGDEEQQERRLRPTARHPRRAMNPARRRPSADRRRRDVHLW
jgi:hypothetical protein